MRDCSSGLTLGVLLSASVLFGCSQKGDSKSRPTSDEQTAAAGDSTWIPIPVTVGRATTHIERPLRPDGYVDYLESARRVSREGVTPENNAAVLIFRAIGPSHIDAEFREEYFRRLGIPEPPDDGPYFVDINAFAARHDVEIGYDEERKLRATTLDRKWSREDSSLVANWLAANEAPLRLFAEASRRSHFHLPLVTKDADNTLDQVIPPLLNPIRDAVSAFRQRAMLHVGEGRLREAETDLRTIHRLASLLQKATNSTIALVGTAFQGIACDGDVVLAFYGKPTSAEATAYLAEFEQFHASMNLVKMVDVEMRQFQLAKVCRLLRQGLPENAREKLVEFGFEGLDEVFPRNQQDADAELEGCNALFDAVVSALRQPTFAERLCRGRCSRATFVRRLSRIRRSWRPTSSWALGKRAAARPTEWVGSGH